MLDGRPIPMFALFFATCLTGPAATPTGPPLAAPERRIPFLQDNAGGVSAGAGNVVLVTIDGVRWQEIFTGADPRLADAAALPRDERRLPRGLTPNLHRLFFDQGTVLGDPRTGEPFNASGPTFVSLPGYVEITTGAISGCPGNDCDPHVSWATVPGSTAGTPEPTAAVFASWERIARAVPADAAGLLVHAGRGAGDEAPPYPGTGEYLPDRRTAALAIDHLVHHRPRFLWVALGDTDEWAHRHDYRGYVEALRFADDFVGELAAHLAEMGDYGARTAIFVTTDHGRDESFADHGGPASAGVWLMARGGPVAEHGATPLARVRHLRDIAPTIGAILGQPGPPDAAAGDVLRARL
jgi:hypothetical protein